jgi:hypothetical protein
MRLIRRDIHDSWERSTYEPRVSARRRRALRTVQS